MKDGKPLGQVDLFLIRKQEGKNAEHDYYSFKHKGNECYDMKSYTFSYSRDICILVGKCSLYSIFYGSSGGFCFGGAAQYGKEIIK